jgi:hypothetical protein
MPSGLVSPVFAGREFELTLLAGAFADAAAGTPGTVLIGAEAGGGKSRLVGEFAATVRDRALVLVGGCVELGAGGLPYAPFTAALRQLVRARGVAEVAALLPGQGAAELGVLLPDFGTPTADPETARARLFEVLLTLLETLAEQQPVVLVVEDVHWADRLTCDLLSFLVRNIRQVYQRGGGVPLLTEALVNPDGTVSAALPRSLRDLLLAVVAAMPERTRQVLRIAAVSGTRLDHALFTAVTGLDDTDLTAALRPAVDANVLVSDADGYDFRHQLIREAVLEDLLPGERAQAHRAFAQALESGAAESGAARAGTKESRAARAGAQDAARTAAQLARHWRGAHEDKRALLAAWQAAADAGAGFAYAQRLQMLELVLELWDQVPDADRPAGTDHVGVLERAADAARWAGEPERGLALVEEAIAELGAADDPERMASMLRRRAGLWQEMLLPGQLDDLQEALRLAAAPSLVRAQVLARLSWALMREERYSESERLARELRALAGRLGDEEHRTEAELALAALGAYRGEDTVADVRAAREAAARIGSGSLEVWAYLTLTNALEGFGQHELGIQAGRDGLARARQLGLAREIAARIAANLAESLTSAGRWDEALEILDELLGLDLPALGRFHPLLGRGRIAVDRGEQETAARTLREMRSLPAGVHAESQRELPLLQLEIDYALAEGDLAGALRAGRACLAAQLGANPRYEWPLLATAMRACTAASAARLPEDAGDPVQLRKGLESQAADIARLGPVHHAWAATFRAEAARADGHQDMAAWDAAATAWDALGQPYPLAYALLGAAGAAAAAADRDGAARRLRRAAELAGQLGARPLLGKIGQLARRARIDLPAARNQAAETAPFGLTEREQEVLSLVAAGRSNRDRGPYRPPQGRPHLVPHRGGDRRQQAQPGARPRHHDPADDRRDRHHLVRDRCLALAPGPGPGRPPPSGPRAGTDGHCPGGTAARLRAGHDGAPGGHGLRFPRAPDEGGRLATAPISFRQPGPGCLRRPWRRAARPGQEPPRRLRARQAPLPRLQPGPDGTAGGAGRMAGPLPGLRAGRLSGCHLVRRPGTRTA